MVKPLFIIAMWGFLGFSPGWCAAKAPPGATQKVPPVSAFFADESSEVFRISPNGRLVAFLKFDGKTCCLSVGDPKNLAATSISVTGNEDGAVFSFLWVDDSRIAFTSRLPDQLTRIGCADIHRPLQNGIRSIQSPRILAQNKGRIHLSGILSRPDRALEVLVSEQSEHDPSFADLVAIDPFTGKRELIYRNTDSLAIVVSDRIGKGIVGIRCLPDASKELVSVRAGAAEVLLTCQPGESLNIEGLDPAGISVFVSTDHGDTTEFQRLLKVDLTSGECRVVGEDPLLETDLSEVLFDRDGGRLLACRYYRHRPEYVWLASDIELQFRAMRKLLPHGDVRLQDSSRDGSRWILSLTTDTEPDAEYYYDGKTAQMLRLDHHKNPLHEGLLGRMQAVRYPARDGRLISGYLTIPQGAPNRNLPLVVFPHGGPNKRNYWGYDPRVQFFAARGYAVFQPNFRGSSGFGKDFLNAGNRQWGRGVMQDDISDGVAWLIANGMADPRRVAIVGGSYGGFAALAGLAFTSDLYACGVSLFGASDLNAFLRDVPDDWKPYGGELVSKIGDTGDAQGADRLARQSPANYIRDIRSPVLIYQGANDPLVRRTQADHFVVACKKNGVHVEYLVSATAGHGFDNPMDEQAVFLAIEQFLARHIGGRQQEVLPDDLLQHLGELRRAGASALGSSDAIGCGEQPRSEQPDF